MQLSLQGWRAAIVMVCDVRMCRIQLHHTRPISVISLRGMLSVQPTHMSSVVSLKRRRRLR